MANEWVDVCIHAHVDAGELLGVLNDSAVQGAWEDGETIHLYWPNNQWNGDRLAAVRGLLVRFGQAEGGEIPWSVNRLPYRDWNQLWAQSVKPLRIGPRLVIRPSWEPVELLPGEIEIILDPKQAFGTGHHATTRVLLEWLQDHVRGGETILDVGAGSGILAMAALRLGATSAVGIECDAVAIECAQGYARENGFGEELKFVNGTLTDLTGRLRPDLVVANLDCQTLLHLADDLAAYGMEGAKLWCSGVLVDQEAEVVARYSALGLYPVHRRELDGWVAIELMRPASCEGTG